MRRKDTSGFPVERFKYDAHKDVVRCPNRKTLTRRNTTKSGCWYRADRHDCAACPLRPRCILDAAPSRRVHITNHLPAILRARRKRRDWGDKERDIYTRHAFRQILQSKIAYRAADGVWKVRMAPRKYSMD